MATSKQLYLVKLYEDEDRKKLINFFVSHTPENWVKFYKNKNKFVTYTTVQQMDLH